MRRPFHLTLVVLVQLASTGCYLSHMREEPDGSAPSGSDAGTSRRDGGTGTDAGAPPGCCTTWSFDRRVAIEDFSEGTVTPRLIRLGDVPAVVVTGPEDPRGPSGAHLVTWSRDLTTHAPPMAVTSGSFTWGQPASAGDRFAVCWGIAPGNAVRVFDVTGRPLTEQAMLDDITASPCVGSAASGGQFAFAYLRRDPATMRSSIRVRLVDGATGAVGAAFDAELTVETQAVSLAGTRNGFVLAIAGAATRLVAIDSSGRALNEVVLGPSRRVRVVASEESAVLVRELERAVSGMRVEHVWLAQAFAPITLAPQSAEAELATFEPDSPDFDATMSKCGEPMLSTSQPGLAAVESLASGARLRVYLPTAPLTGPLTGDTSVLVIDDDAYVAFSSSVPGGPSPRVHIDHWVCTAH